MSLELVYLTPVRAEDAAELFPLVSDPRCYEFLVRKGPASLDELRTRYQELATGRSPDGKDFWLSWVVRETCTHHGVGLVQAWFPPDADVAQVGYLFGAPYWGKGYAKASLQLVMAHVSAVYQITKFRASTDSNNHRSIRLLTTLGFSPTNLPATQPGDTVYERLTA